jgi:hypothetical protein
MKNADEIGRHNVIFIFKPLKVNFGTSSMDDPNTSVSKTFYKQQPAHFYAQNQIEKHNNPKATGRPTSIVLGSYVADSKSQIKSNERNIEIIQEGKELK